MKDSFFNKCKWLVVLTMRVLAYPVSIGVKVTSSIVGERKGMLGLSQFLSLIPGYTGILVRNAVYSHLLKEVAWNATISFGTVFSSPMIWIGREVFINTYCDIGKAIICDKVVIGPRVIIMSGRRQHIMKTERNGKNLDIGNYEIVRIGRNTWIGSGAIIGAHVGANCIIGAGSVVVKSVADNQVVVGNPAKVVRSLT